MRGIIVALILVMSVLALLNLFDVSVAGISILIGIIGFILYRNKQKELFGSHVLSLKRFWIELKMNPNWFWLVLPLILNIVSLSLAAAILPDFIDHLGERVDVALSFQVIFILVIQLAIMALGEEIAWRAFFQKQLTQYISVVPAILLTSLVFSLGHFSIGPALVVGYDLLFIFINSVVYGIIFLKTNNVWMSALSHFAANTLAIFAILFLF